MNFCVRELYMDLLQFGATFQFGLMSNKNNGRFTWRYNFLSARIASELAKHLSDCKMFGTKLIEDYEIYI